MTFFFFFFWRQAVSSADKAARQQAVIPELVSKAVGGRSTVSLPAGEMMVGWAGTGSAVAEHMKILTG